MEANQDKVIEVLINNAGIREDALMMWMKDEQWDSVIGTSLGGFFYVTRLVGKQYADEKVWKDHQYCFAFRIKRIAWPDQLFRSQSRSYRRYESTGTGNRQEGNYGKCYSTGFIKTDMTEGLNENELKALIPLKRFGLPEEVAHAVGFLASAEASYITAEVISVNGGLYS